MKKFKKNKLMVFSFDAMNSMDYDLVKEIPLFKEFIEEGAHVSEVMSVYPSLTYPAHTSIMTSVFPSRHGIYNNLINDQNLIQKPDWFWFKKDILVKTIYDYLEENNYKNSAFFFPVMAGEKRGYVVPEIFSPRDGKNVNVMIKHCPKKLYYYLWKHKNILQGLTQPHLDNFIFSVAKDVYKKQKPDTCFIHFTQLDTWRHDHGFSGNHVEESYLSMANKVNEMIELTKQLGTYDETNFIILGDHGGRDTLHDISLNKLFLDNKLLEVDGIGIKNAKCHALDAGGSAQIFLNDKRSDDVLMNLLIKLKNDGFIKDIFNTDEARLKYNLSGDFAYVVEAADNYQFVGEIMDEVITYNEVETKPDHLLNHGHLPTNPYLKTMLFMKGPNVRKGASIPKSSIVDEGVTFLKMLGIDMPNVDGKVLKELIKH